MDNSPVKFKRGDRVRVTVDVPYKGGPTLRKGTEGRIDDSDVMGDGQYLGMIPEGGSNCILFTVSPHWIEKINPEGTQDGS
jgi:hypothetical protein